MPHVVLVPFTGFRVREEELLALGMTLPGLAERGRALGQLPALGLLTLAGILPDDWTCEYLPAQRVDDELLESIAVRHPTLVAVSALTASAPEAYRFCDRLRELNIPTVLGGLHATVCPTEAAQHATAVAVGAGEATWQTILRDARDGRLQPIYRPSDAPLTWPLPRFDLVGPHAARFTLQTARGCPLACEFCGASRLLGPFREKPAENIRRELAAIRELSPRPRIELADDNTFAGGRLAEELFDVLSEHPLRYFTECDWRIGERPDVVRGLARSGCVQVLMGFESQVFRYPGMGQKSADWERMIAAAERLQEAGVCVNACFIVGSDGETRESLARLVEFLLASPFAEIQLTLQTPFPGTGLHRRLQGEGRLLPERDWSHYTLFDVTYQPDVLSVEELEQGFREALAAVFATEPSARRKRLRKEIARRRMS